MHRTTGTGNVAGLFTGGPPATCLTPEFLNSIQEEICGVIESAGIAVATDGYSDTKNQLLTAIRTLLPTSQYDVIVTNQAQFNAIIERIGANHYHIRDSYRSVLLRNTGIGYLCGGSGSFLSGGDTWGYLQTNNCTHFRMENGAYLDIAGTAFYFEQNTDNCKCDNVWIRGNESISTTTVSIFRLNGSNVIYDNCRVSNLSSSSTCRIFDGFTSATDDQILTTKFIGCSSFTLRPTEDLYIFASIKNVSNCLVYDASTTTAGVNIECFKDIYNIGTCTANNISTTTGTSVGFTDTYQCSSCYAYNLHSTTGANYGFSGSHNLTSCFADEITSTGAALVYGFNSCTYMSSCQAGTITTVGGTENGFHSCSYMASCYTTEAANAGNDFVNTDDTEVATNFSCPGTVWT